MNDEPDYLKDHLDEDSPNRYLEMSLPHSEEAERALLGQCIFAETHLLQSIELLDGPDDFYLPSNRKIYEAMINLFDAGKPIDPISIGEELKKTNDLQTVGGFSYLTGLTYGLPHEASIEHIANIIIGKSKLRQLVKAAAKIHQEAIEEEDDHEVILGHAEAQIYQLTETRYKTKLESIDEAMETVVTDAIANVGSGMAVTGLRTGLTLLDNLTTGLQKSDLILLAARPSIGKTSEAVSIIVNCALDFQKKVSFFTLEMSKYAIIGRMVCNVARVDFQRFRNGFLSVPEQHAILEAKTRLSCHRIFLDDKPGITMLEMRAKLHRMEQQIGLPDLIVVDYLQLMTGRKEHRKESRQQEVSGVSEDLKALAKELDRPVLALAQLNRGPEQRSDKVPLLSDLRESGALEQNADVVIFLHRPKTDEDLQHVMTQIVSKNRNGPTGEFGIYFNGPAMRFDNLD